MTEFVRISVVYVAPGVEHVVELAMATGASIADAVRESGLASRILGFAVGAHSVGVWGRVRPAEALLVSGDRVEIYRPLSVDPNVARQRRVAKKRAGTRV